MSAPGLRVPSFRFPPRTLRLRLTLLYAAVFAGCAVLLGAAAVIFKPGFLVHSAYQAAGGRSHAVSRPWDGSLGSFLAGFTHDHDVAGGAAMLALLIVLAAGAGWLIAGRVVRPLRAITSTARAISASSLHERVDARARGNEFAELGDTLNGLFGRLQAAFDSQRRFVANASHELRTPLSASRALLQVALADPDASVESLRATCQEVLDLGDQQERLIAALLTLASGQRGLERTGPLDLAEIAQKVIAAMQHEAGSRGIQLSTALAPAPVTGDPSLAGSLVANLIGNAIRHNSPGGQVEVAAGRASGGSFLAVRNTGPVIPPEEVGALFEPFRQLGADRVRHGVGNGLGLAIVRAIADAHGATLTAHARPLGGLDIRVEFPGRVEPPDQPPAAVLSATAPSSAAATAGQ